MTTTWMMQIKIKQTRLLQSNIYISDGLGFMIVFEIRSGLFGTIEWLATHCNFYLSNAYFTVASAVLYFSILQ